ncbi:hypothetical protein HG536_0E04630 [Torulaspora globosa]|uniref:Methionine--tRNA ligase, mitochondrial n=1 Tax=Torulaspora globosa TaxID=48254 RepID=A0A7G3ZJ66_9SACH|nr:uncharacterized protein HG536_0E04630 [Torulaspora globosa]QLL33552.1 hypothetical protein HG536_0E04630 [Torulaspora globosa]
MRLWGPWHRRLHSQVSHITTPIFYPNARPHLGHLYSSLLCDVFHRWQLFKKGSSLFTTGTDEHGLKIQAASERAGYASPREFVDNLCRDFVKLDRAGDIRFTRFIRTTDADHVENVRKLWKLCDLNGFIYRGEHKGWYSVSDETFYPESKVQRSGTDADKFINTETGNEVVYHTETNYFFKLSAFRERLVAYITENPRFIDPSAKRLQVLRELQEEGGLPDISISRPSSRLKWGIDVPGDPSQKVYVWFDALCNYVSSVGGIDAILQDAIPEVALRHEGGNLEVSSAEWWRNTTHVIGKDIIKFHTIYWPAFLMAAGLPLPKQIVVHSHWLSNGVKMSKSLGNVVDPLLMIDHYGRDAMRWFLLENSQLEDDNNFQEDKLHSTRELLVSKWGNLVNRCCGAKFNLQRAVATFASMDRETLLNLLDGDQMLKEAVQKLFTELDMISEKMDGYISRFESRAALRNVWSVIDLSNTLIQDSKPWTKEGPQQDVIIYACMEASRILSILCQPIIPSLAARLLDRIDVPLDRRSVAFTKVGTDDLYGRGSNERGRPVPLQRKPLREQ